MIRTAREILEVCVAFALLSIAVARAKEGAALRAAQWPDTPIARVEALALLESLNADLLSNDSATLTLDRWCEAHKMAAPAKIVAERVHGSDKTPTDDIRQLLGLSATDPVRYRHVRLHCGEHVLSEADNWYVPARLTPEMNQLLDTTDTAFGRAVQALHFHRRILWAQLLWLPLPQGWEMGAALPDAATGPLQIPAQIIQHRAVLALPDGTPFSVVIETYTSEVLAFPKPPRP
jgi:chorismate-pyruvate lyase